MSGSEPASQANPFIIIIMGVTGSGKTTIGRRLASRLGLPFHDADDYHSPASLEKLAADKPLTDADREPWLRTLEECIAKWGHSSGAVLACSALKHSYRKRFRNAAPNVRFVYLSGDVTLIAERVAERATREDHIVKEFAAILENQFRDLEVPTDALTVDVHQTPDQIVDQIVEALQAGARDTSSSRQPH